jgi:ankyrin repeat protein
MITMLKFVMFTIFSIGVFATDNLEVIRLCPQGHECQHLPGCTYCDDCKLNISKEMDGYYDCSICQWDQCVKCSVKAAKVSQDEDGNNSTHAETITSTNIEREDDSDMESDQDHDSTIESDDGDNEVLITKDVIGVNFETFTDQEVQILEKFTDQEVQILEKFTDQEVQILAKMKKDNLYEAIQGLHQERINKTLNAEKKNTNEKMKENLQQELAFAIEGRYGKNVELVLNRFRIEAKEKMIEYLMKEDLNKSTFLHFATENRLEVIVKLLLNAFDKKEKTMHKNIVSFLIGTEKQKLIEYTMKKNENNETCLHIAAKNGDIEIIKSLFDVFGKGENEKMIESSMKKNENGKKNMKLHQYTMIDEHEKVVKWKLDNSPNERKKQIIQFFMIENKNQETALHVAARNGHIIVVKFLLNAFGEFENAFKHENDNLIQYLMKENSKKETALHFAAQNGHTDIVNLLLKVFSKEEKQNLIQFVMKENDMKSTSLHYASKSGNEEISKALLNVFDEDENDELIEYVKKQDLVFDTASDIAKHKKHKDPIQLLELNKSSKLYKALTKKSFLI